METLKDIRDRFSSYEEYYKTLHKEQKEIDTYYELTFDASVPDQYPTRMPPTARNWVDVGVRHFTLDNPKAKVDPRRDSDEERKRVAIKEVLYTFWLRKDIRQIKKAARKLLKRGEVFLKVNMDDTYFGTYKGKPITDLDADELKEYQDKRLFRFPLFLTGPDPINVFPSPAHEGLVPVDLFEYFSTTVAEAQALCERNGWKWETDKSPTYAVNWMIYTSNDLRCFLLDDEPVLPDEIQPNLFGFCPYVHIDAGFGDDSYEGKPEYLYRSIIWPQKDMLKMEVRNLSQTDAILARYAWPRVKAIGDPDQIKKLYPNGIPTDPGEVWYEIPNTATLEVLQGEQPPASLFTQQAMIQSYASPPAVLSGMRPAGVYSGQFQETLIGTAKPIYKDAFKNLEDGLGVAMGMGARIIEQVYKHDVEIKDFASDERKYNRITPSDIDGHYDCEVQLLAEPPEATDMRKALGRTLRQAGSIGHMTELRNYQDMSQEEAEDEIAQMVVEGILQEPFMREVVGKDAASRLGMDRVLEELENAETQMAKSIPPVPKPGPMATGRENIKKRGRVAAGLERLPGTREGQGGLAP